MKTFTAKRFMEAVFSWRLFIRKIVVEMMNAVTSRRLPPSWRTLFWQNYDSNSQEEAAVLSGTLQKHNQKSEIWVDHVTNIPNTADPQRQRDRDRQRQTETERSRVLLSSSSSSLLPVACFIFPFIVLLHKRRRRTQSEAHLASGGWRSFYSVWLHFWGQTVMSLKSALCFMLFAFGKVC